MGWCDANPVDNIEVPRVQEQEIVPLTLQEVEKLEQAAELPEHRAMRTSLHLMLYCGLRPNEVARLRPDDIQLHEKRVLIHPRTSKTGGGRVVPIRKAERLKGARIRIPRNWQNRWLALRRAAGFTHWGPIPEPAQNPARAGVLAVTRNTCFVLKGKIRGCWFRSTGLQSRK